MKYFNKIKKKNLIITILLIAEVFSLILTYKSFNNKKVELSNNLESENRNFSMYVQDEDGEYYLSDKHYFPNGDGYELNYTLSSCQDVRGNTIDTNFTFLNGKVTVTSNKTVYCTIYFDMVKILSKVLKASQLSREYRGMGYYYDNENPFFTNPIYYYNSESETDTEAIKEQWNVVFAGFCWQMYRTTDSGGVKLLFNGSPKETINNQTGEISYSCGNDRTTGEGFSSSSTAVSFSYGYTYYFGTSFERTKTGKYKLTGDITTWRSGTDESSTYKKYSCHSTSSADDECDTLYYINGSPISSGHNTLYANSISSSSGSLDKIATSAYNGYSLGSLYYYGNYSNYEGYMYSDYELKVFKDFYYKNISIYTDYEFFYPVDELLDSNRITSSNAANYYFGTDFTVDENNNYQLSGTVTLGSSLNSNSKVGRYTLRSNSSDYKSPRLYYIVKWNSSENIYYYISEYGAGIDPVDKVESFVAGTGFTYNEVNETYTLINPRTYTYMTRPSNAKYMCSDHTSSTCGNRDIQKISTEYYGRYYMVGLNPLFSSKIAVSEDITDNGNGTYTLNNPSYYNAFDTDNYYLNCTNYICSTGDEVCSSENLYKPADNSYSRTTPSIEAVNPSDIIYFSNTISYDDSTGMYTLDMNDSDAQIIDFFEISSIDKYSIESAYPLLANVHYVCIDEDGKVLRSTSTCERVGYMTYFYDFPSWSFKGIALSNGEYVSIDESSTTGMTKFADDNNVIYKLFYKNNNSSNIKKIVDDWYRAYLLRYYDSYIDHDEIYCGDDSIKNYGGFQTNVNYFTESLTDVEFGRYTTPSEYIKGDRTFYYDYPIVCYEKSNAYSANETTYGNGDLTYPIALITAPEVKNMGDWHQNNSSNTLVNGLFDGSTFYTMTPVMNTRGAVVYTVNNALSTPGGLNSTYGVRPVIALNPSVSYSRGDGSTTNPYVIEIGHKVSVGDVNYAASKNLANEGETVNIYHKSKNLFEVRSFYLNGTLVTGNSFTMPNEDAVITNIVSERVAYSITNTDSDVSVPEYAIIGTTIYLEGEGRVNDFKVTSFSINGTPITGNSFTMPNEDVIITNIVKEQTIYVHTTHYPVTQSTNTTIYYENTFEGATSITVNYTYQNYYNYIAYNSLHIGTRDSNGTWVTSQYYNTSGEITTRTNTINGNSVIIMWEQNANHDIYLNVYGFSAEIIPNYN